MLDGAGTASWDGLLDGEELAFRTVRAGAGSPTAKRCPTISTLSSRRRSLRSRRRPGCTRTRRRRGRRPRRGEHVIVTTGTASGQVARVQPPGARRDRAASRRRGRSTSTRRRRWPRIRRGRSAAARPEGPAARDLRRRHARRAPLADPQVGERDPDEPGHAPRRHPARITTAGATCCTTSATSSSTRRTSTAASSARTSGTCCGGCGGSHVPTAPSRSSSRVGHDRERRRARARAHGGVRDRRRHRHLAARRAGHRALEPAAARPGARPAGERARRGLAADGRARRRAACGRSASRRAARRRS